MRLSQANAVYMETSPTSHPDWAANAAGSGSRHARSAHESLRADCVCEFDLSVTRDVGHVPKIPDRHDLLINDHDFDEVTWPRAATLVEEGKHFSAVEPAGRHLPRRKSFVVRKIVAGRVSTSALKTRNDIESDVGGEHCTQSGPIARIEQYCVAREAVRDATLRCWPIRHRFLELAKSGSCAV